MGTITRPTPDVLTVSQIDKRLAVYARQLKNDFADVALTREQAIEDINRLLDLRLELTGATA